MDDIDLFYKIIKLKTGETVACSMEEDVNFLNTQTHLILINPVQVIPLKETTKGNTVVGENYMLKPWMGLSDSEEFMISVDIVMTLGDLKSQVRNQYIEYVEHTAKTSKKQKESEQIETAIYNLLRDVNNNGEVYIINDDLVYGENNDNQEDQEG